MRHSNVFQRIALRRQVGIGFKNHVLFLILDMIDDLERVFPGKTGRHA